MHPRVRIVLIAGFACAFAAIAGVWLAALTSSDAAPRTAAASPTGFEGALRPAGTRLPDFRLTDQDGKPVGPATRGPAVYAFIYSHCEDTCPLEVQQIRGALDDLGKDVPVYGISVDPANDTQASARRFVLEQHMTGRMTFALGSRAELEPIWKAFGIQPQTGSEKVEDHSASVVLVDAQGRQRVGFTPTTLSTRALAADLTSLGA